MRMLKDSIPLCLIFMLFMYMLHIYIILRYNILSFLLIKISIFYAYLFI